MTAARAYCLSCNQWQYVVATYDVQLVNASAGTNLQRRYILACGHLIWGV